MLADSSGEPERLEQGASVGWRGPVATEIGWWALLGLGLSECCWLVSRAAWTPDVPLDERARNDA